MITPEIEHVDSINAGNPVDRQTIEKYISKRYQRWAEYALFRCSEAGIPSEHLDVLNEVLFNLLKKDPEKLEKLMRPKGKYLELDYFILRMIHLNAHSATSPYQYQYHHPGLKQDNNIPLARFEDEDPSEDDITIQGVAVVEEEEEDFSFDNNDLICKRMDFLRELLEKMQIPKLEKEIFSHRILQGEPASGWRGKEPVTKITNTTTKLKKQVKFEIEKQLISGALQKAIHSLPHPNDKALARLIFEYGFQPDELRKAGFPVKYLFPLYQRMQAEVKAFAINYLKSEI